MRVDVRVTKSKIYVDGSFECSCGKLLDILHSLALTCAYKPQLVIKIEDTEVRHYLESKGLCVSTNDSYSYKTDKLDEFINTVVDLVRNSSAL